MICACLGQYQCDIYLVSTPGARRGTPLFDTRRSTRSSPWKDSQPLSGSTSQFYSSEFIHPSIRLLWDVEPR